jgi:hypothetical protein
MKGRGANRPLSVDHLGVMEKVIVHVPYGRDYMLNSAHMQLVGAAPNECRMLSIGYIIALLCRVDFLSESFRYIMQHC